MCCMSVGVAEDPGPRLDPSHIPRFRGFALHPHLYWYGSNGGVIAEVHNLQLTQGLLYEENYFTNIVRPLWHVWTSKLDDESKFSGISYLSCD